MCVCVCVKFDCPQTLLKSSTTSYYWRVWILLLLLINILISIPSNDPLCVYRDEHTDMPPTIPISYTRKLLTHLSHYSYYNHILLPHTHFSAFSTDCDGLACHSYPEISQSSCAWPQLKQKQDISTMQACQQGPVLRNPAYVSQYGCGPVH